VKLPVVERVQPALADAPPVPTMPDLAQGRLSNGIEWLHVERPGLPLVDVLIVVRAGADLDSPVTAGLASLTAELLEEGTHARTGLEVAASIDHLGASLSIRPGWDETSIGLHTLAPRLSDGLLITADVLRNASFPDAEVSRLREERRASLLQERDEPTAIAARALAESIYGNAHPYGTAPRGTRASVATLDRHALATFHRVRYHPSSVFTVSVGEVPAQQMADQLERVLGDWTADATGQGPIPWVAAPNGVIIHLVDRPGAPQSEIRIGCAGPHRATPDYAQLVVLNTILGGAFTSRLNLKLREEKGFTYGARSHFAFRRGPGPFVAGTAVATPNTAEAVQDALREIARLRDEPVPATELERARNYLALGLPRRIETGSAMAAQLADLHLHGLDPAELVNFVTRVREVTSEDILETARTWLDPSAMSVVVVGDAAAARGPLETLRLGPVQPCVVET